MAIGWDLRMGWWNDAQGGYWQSTTGNGGAPGTGLKLLAPARKNGGSQRQDRWHCVEQQIRMNSIVGPFDGVGNGTAIDDGVIRTWLDGVLCGEVTNLRWRRHPEMGVQGPWVNWFYGGKLPTETPMHYRMNHFVLSRKYIGPRVD